MTFTRALLAILAVIVVHVIAMLTALYGIFPWWDMPMHFAGGFVMAMLAIAIHSHMTNKKHVRRVGDIYHIVFILGFTMLIAVAWEFHEYVIDQTIGLWNNWQPTQLSLGDTMLDLFLGFVGGLTAALTFRKDW
jgi:hypothetical protein